MNWQQRIEFDRCESVFFNLKICSSIMEPKQECCIICFQSSNNNIGRNNFVQLSTRDCESKTYVDKIQYLTNYEIVIYDCSLICVNCTKELNEACKFREKVVQALEYWSNNCSVNIKSNQSGDLEQNIIDYIETSCLGTVSEVSQNDEVSTKVNTEEEPPTFSCDKCRLIFLTASELLHHDCLDYVSTEKETKSSINNGKENAAYKCEICEKSFDKNWQLNRHIKVFHLNVKNYICSYCNRGFKQLYHLQEHVTSHTGERKFKCNICTKTFSRMSSQRKHMKAHESAPGEKSKKSPFLCPICGKKFPYSNGAQRHIRTHFDDRRFECKICGNKFSQTTHLRVHLRTHTGEKPYPCNLCAESFSLNANLRKHMKNHKKPENLKIFHNLEPNLSQTNGEFDFEESQSDFIKRELPFSFVEGGF